MPLNTLTMQSDFDTAKAPFKSRFAAAELKKKDPKKKKEGEKEYNKVLAEFSKAAGEVFAEQMKLVVADAKRITADFDKRIGLCREYLKAGKDAFDRSQWMVVEGLPGTIQFLITQSENEKNAHGKAWFSYRSGMPGKDDDFDPAQLAKFNALRQDAMNEGKLQLGKIEQMAKIKAQADELLKDAQTERKDVADLLDDARSDAAEAKAKAEAASKSADDLDHDLSNKSEAMTGAVESMTKKTAAAALKTFASSYADAIAKANTVKTTIQVAESGVKSVRNRYRTMNDATYTQALSAADAEIVKAKNSAKGIVKHLQVIATQKTKAETKFAK